MLSGHSSGTLAVYYELREPERMPDSPVLPTVLLIHGGGSTIESNWGNLIPELETGRRLLAVELQGHGRTASGAREPSFVNSADDVAALLDELGLGAVDVLGFSNGGQVAMQLAARRPELVRRLIVASAPYRRDGMIDGFWPSLESATFESMPQVYADADLAVSGDREHARRMFELDRALMLGFSDWPDELPASITARTLVIVGDRDVVTVDHAVRLREIIPGSALLVVPGLHGQYLGERLAAEGGLGSMRQTIPVLLGFLDAP
jgi:pimeloyl-ACP methyl ester carboxylesterase